MSQSSSATTDSALGALVMVAAVLIIGALRARSKSPLPLDPSPDFGNGRAPDSSGAFSPGE